MSYHKIGVVIIGRNEGERLGESIKSVGKQQAHIVYVDSGSSDNSVELAHSLGCDVVELDMSSPFTAGRGRNAGFAYLLKHYPQIEFVQFIDGDCILHADWISAGHAKMLEDSKIGVVCGRRRERFPRESIYNLLCDMEWNTPVGEATQCGGDALIRVSAFQAVDGYDNAFAAGEEPELCFRARQLGWKIWRLDEEMVLHDADMTRFSQWWRRTLRSGSAYGQSAYTHWNNAEERFCVRDSISIWLWALVVPLIAFSLFWATNGFSLLLFGLYVVLTWRIFRYRRNMFSDSVEDSLLYAVFCVLGKIPQALGQARFYIVRQSSLIEYKGPEKAAVKDFAIGD